MKLAALRSPPECSHACEVTVVIVQVLAIPLCLILCGALPAYIVQQSPKQNSLLDRGHLYPALFASTCPLGRVACRHDPHHR